jgi:AraC family transcriptional regulator
MPAGAASMNQPEPPSSPPTAKPRPGTADEHATRLYRAFVFIEENLHNHIDVTDVARVACYTPRHFQRIFCEATGEGVRDYIRRLRVTLAATLLRHTRLSVTDAAFAAGFQTIAGFDRAFTAVLGCAPSDYRALPEGKDAAPGAIAALRVELAEEPPRRLAFLRHLGPEFDAVRVWIQLAAWAKAHGLLTDDAVLLGIAHDDDDVPPAQRRYDACLEIAPDFDPGPGFGVRELPGGLVARHRFRGTLPALEHRWQLLTRHWFPASGYALRLPLGYDRYPARLVRPLALARHLLPGAVIEATLHLPIAPGRRRQEH